MLYYSIWGLVSALYGPILYQLYHGRWEVVDYTHAYFTLPASLFIVWYKRKELRSLVVQPSSLVITLSLFLLGIGLFLFYLGWRNDFLFISTFSMIPVLGGLTGYLYGTKVLQKITFPLIYLFFMVPPPLGILDAITLPLRKVISVIAAFLLESMFIPVHREGLLLFLGKQEVFMAPACSGFRSLITFMSLALLYVYFKQNFSFKKKAVLIASVIPLALFGNLIRVMMLCLITYFFGKEMGQGFLHDLSGVMVFLIIVTGFLIIERFYEADDEGDA